MEGKQSVAFIGVGMMGAPMATRLHAAGFDVIVQDFRPEHASDVGKRIGCRIALTLSDVSDSQPDLIITCLPTSKDVKLVATTLATASKGLKEGTVWIDCTSGDPFESQAIAKQLANNTHGRVGFVDAGVSGGMKGASEGTLTAMVGGSDQDVQLSRSVLTAFCAKVVHVGGVGAGHSVKAVNNSLLGMNLWSASEGLVTLKKMGVDPAAALDAINSSSGRSWVTLQRFPSHILNRQFDYGFRLALLRKDMMIASKMSTASGVHTPLLHSGLDLYGHASRVLSPTADHVEVAKVIEDFADITLSSAAAAAIDESAVSPRSPDLRALGIKMVVFDCAGTVVNEGAIVYQTLIRVMQEHGLVIEDEEFNKWHGANKIEVIRHFVKQQKPEWNEEKVQELYELFIKGIEKAYFDTPENISVFPGVPSLFEQLQKAGIKVCLNTGYPRHVAERLVSVLGLKVDGLVVAEDVGYGRPYPYMIHHLMKQFLIMDAKTVAKVGDTARDMEEGNNAGCGLIIGVLSGADDVDTLVQAGAHLVLPSVASMYTSIE